VAYLRTEITLPDGTTIVTEKRVTYIQPDWSAYHRAQCDEKHRVHLLLRGLCDGIAQPERDLQPPRLSLGDAVYSMTMKVYTAMSGRCATTDIRESLARNDPVALAVSTDPLGLECLPPGAPAGTAFTRST
jgi:hypothetical protein